MAKTEDKLQPDGRREPNYKPGKISEAHRERIQVAKLIDVLHEHAFGKKKLTITRLKAIEILLKKKLPDLGVETNRGEVAPVTFVFGAAPVHRVVNEPDEVVNPGAVGFQSPPPSLTPGSLPRATPPTEVTVGGAEGRDAAASAPLFVMAPSKPPETTH